MLIIRAKLDVKYTSPYYISQAFSLNKFESFDRIKHKFARKVLRIWIEATEERLQAKQAIQDEIERQRTHEILVNEQTNDYAENLYLLNLCRKAIEALRDNMAPRTNYMRKLVTQYYFESLKKKGLKALITYKKWKKADFSGGQKRRYFFNWLMLLRERRMARNLKTPFLNIQRSIFDDLCTKKGSHKGMIKTENYYLIERVYQFRHLRLQSKVFKKWKYITVRNNVLVNSHF